MAHDMDITSRTPRRYPFSRNRLDPDPQYAELRRTDPVCRVQLPYGPPAWLVTGYHLTKSVFGDARFSRAATIGRDNPRECAVEFGQVAESVMSMDPPAHTRIRHLAGRAFTAHRVERLRPRAQQIASGLIDDMAASGPPADLVESFSFAFPAIIICELLGIPAADRHAFRGWTDAIVSTATSTPEQAQDTYLHLAGYLASLFAQRRAQPGDDLLTWLVQARDNDDRLTETELLFLGMALLAGGYETTAHQITNMVYTLLSHDKQLRQLKARPDRSPSCGTSAPAGVPLAKGIRPLGRQCHRPSSNTASLGDEGVMGRLVHDQGRQLQEGCPAPRRGDWAALHRSADGSRGSRCADAPRARC